MRVASTTSRLSVAHPAEECFEQLNRLPAGDQDANLRRLQCTRRPAKVCCETVPPTWSRRSAASRKLLDEYHQQSVQLYGRRRNILGRISQLESQPRPIAERTFPHHREAGRGNCGSAWSICRALNGLGRFAFGGGQAEKRLGLDFCKLTPLIPLGEGQGVRA